MPWLLRRGARDRRSNAATEDSERMDPTEEMAGLLAEPPRRVLPAAAAGVATEEDEGAGRGFASAGRAAAWAACAWFAACAWVG